MGDRGFYGGDDHRKGLWTQLVSVEFIYSGFAANNSRPCEYSTRLVPHVPYRSQIHTSSQISIITSQIDVTVK